MCNMSEYIWQKGIDEGKKSGIQEGIKEGIKEGKDRGEERFGRLMSILMRSGRAEDMKRAIGDKTYRDELFRQYDIV